MCACVCARVRACTCAQRLAAEFIRVMVAGDVDQCTASLNEDPDLLKWRDVVRAWHSLVP